MFWTLWLYLVHYCIFVACICTKGFFYVPLCFINITISCLLLSLQFGAGLDDNRLGLHSTNRRLPFTTRRTPLTILGPQSRQKNNKASTSSTEASEDAPHPPTPNTICAHRLSRESWDSHQECPACSWRNTSPFGLTTLVNYSVKIDCKGPIVCFIGHALSNTADTMPDVSGIACKAGGVLHILSLSLTEPLSPVSQYLKPYANKTTYWGLPN